MDHIFNILTVVPVERRGWSGDLGRVARDRVNEERKGEGTAVASVTVLKLVTKPRKMSLRYRRNSRRMLLYLRRVGMGRKET